jgi:hypothetical protein
MLSQEESPSKMSVGWKRSSKAVYLRKGRKGKADIKFKGLEDQYEAFGNCKAEH